MIDILQQICNGFKVVHKNNVIHRDIKPANFLIHKGVIKISDFGFARTVNDVDEVVVEPEQTSCQQSLNTAMPLVVVVI